MIKQHVILFCLRIIQCTLLGVQLCNKVLPKHYNKIFLMLERGINN